MKALSKKERMGAVEAEIAECRLCRLCESRSNPVPGEGDLDSPVVFIGEAPGRREDEMGRPFVGSAGRLLDRLLGEVGLWRCDVYITNIVKCRPPNNRTPQRAEMERCQGYLIEQIKMINPRIIVTLGRVATDFFIKSRESMTSLRGEFYDYGSIRIMPTFHPSYLIRNENNRALKKMVWEDMKKVMAFLGKK